MQAFGCFGFFISGSIETASYELRNLIMVSTDGELSNYYVTDDSMLNSTTWYHVALTVSSDLQRTFYLDGMDLKLCGDNSCHSSYRYCGR